MSSMTTTTATSTVSSDQKETVTTSVIGLEKKEQPPIEFHLWGYDNNSDSKFEFKVVAQKKCNNINEFIDFLMKEHSDDIFYNYLNEREWVFEDDNVKYVNESFFYWSRLTCELQAHMKEHKIDTDDSNINEYLAEYYTKNHGHFLEDLQKLRQSNEREALIIVSSEEPLFHVISPRLF